MYDIVSQIYHSWCFLCCMYQIFRRRYQKYSFVLLCEQEISCTDVSEITSQVICSLRWAFWPHINTLLRFLVIESGLNSYSMSLHQICMQIIAKQRCDMYQKSFLTEILPSEVSYLDWYGSKIYIWYCC